ncbi:alpha/beta hydrolase [Streptomyces lichenis]|uniref:Alpha/beta hydrolase n=1 Tax=Streptomyces lichenis TaxID=2306967 RepID=A0ABT0II79_9ACTN|nr:alpha/beta hydrolase [Streptomyces lichenis]MCK8681036.1 alpha/beta hydrolase [Streptomyces lichenis]
MNRFRAPDGTLLAWHGTGTGEPLICLPGGPMRASAYLGDLGGLDRYRRLVRLDLRGTGESAVPKDPGSYRCDRQVDDVEALRVALGLERVDLLAHSAGGDLALAYAARYPERVRALVLVTSRARVLGVEFTVRDRGEAADLRKGEPWYAEGREAYDRIWAGQAGEEDFDAAMPFFYGRWDAAARAHAAGDAGETNEEAGAGYAAPGAFEPEAGRVALGALDAPVLVLAGELDSGPRPEVAREIAALLPHGTAVVQPGGGHYLWLDDQGWFSRTVDGFLERAADGAAG